MRVLVAPFVLVAIAVAVACGGSASETPWPVEPEGFKAGAPPPSESASPASITNVDGGRAPRAAPTTP